MRVDSNTRGHHQWFYFAVAGAKGRLRFNIVNFTKNASLYHQGMRIAVHSANAAKGKGEDEAWTKGGENIVYKMSKLSQARVVPGQGYVYPTAKRYFQLSFDFDFSDASDRVSFAYSQPYSLSRLHRDLAGLPPSPHLKQTVLCKSLGGLDVPLLTITSRVHTPLAHLLDPRDFPD